MDGLTLFFRRGPSMREPLAAHNLRDGTERTVVECVYGNGWGFGVARDGLYYVDCDPASPALHRLDVSAGRDETLGPLVGFWPTGFAVSPDGQTVLHGRRVGEGSNIMLIEDFR
jgi:hypothetical protein